MGTPALAPRSAPAPRPAKPRRRTGAARRTSASRRTAGARTAPRRRPNRPLTSSGRNTRSAAPRRAQLALPALAGAALIPHAAFRTAGAVRDISDSSLILRLTRGRGWIALLCALLGGIVALNVISLSLNAGSGRISQQIEQFERSNSALRAELAEELSASRVEAWAANTGLAVPHPQDVGYLTAGEENSVERLLAQLEDGTLLAGADPLPTVLEQLPYVEAPAAEAVSAPSAEAAGPTPAPAPATATSPSTTSGAGGGVGL